MLPVFTIDDIRDFRPKPCYDPSRYLPEGWSGTALDILAVEECPAADRLWVVLHRGCLDARTARLFAVWCARQALALVDTPDPRSVAACDVAERFANGEVTAEELAAAENVAWNAVMEAPDATWGVAWAASLTVTKDVFRGDSGAVQIVAKLAADITNVHHWSAVWAMWSARLAQVDHLREMLTA